MYLSIPRTAGEFPTDAEERVLHVLVYIILASPTGYFTHSKSAIDFWARSDLGKSYKSWISSTLCNATSVERIARRVFALTSIKSFSVEDEDDHEDDLEDPPEPLEDLYRFIEGLNVYDETLLLHTLAYAVRDYMLIIGGQGHWWNEILGAFETCAPQRLHWSITEGAFIAFLEKVDKHGMTPRDAFLATREQVREMVDRFYQQTDPRRTRSSDHG